MTIGIALVIGILGFAGGFILGQRKQLSSLRRFMGGRNAGGMVQQGQFRQGLGVRPVNGEIIDASEKSITVKLVDGSSRIVIVADTTIINKASDATKEDLKKGEKVAVFGQENSDGSVTAQSVQINPR